MPAGKKWVFNAPYVDRSLIRNALAYKIGRAVGKLRGEEWTAPRLRFAELILNDRYMGIYAIIERIRRQTNRLNIPKAKIKQPHDSPLVLEVSSYDGALRTKLGTRLRLRYPSATKLKAWSMCHPLSTKLLENHILHELNRFERSLWKIGSPEQNETENPRH